MIQRLQLLGIPDSNIYIFHSFQLKFFIFKMQGFSGYITVLFNQIRDRFVFQGLPMYDIKGV